MMLATTRAARAVLLRRRGLPSYCARTDGSRFGRRTLTAAAVLPRFTGSYSAPRLACTFRRPTALAPAWARFASQGLGGGGGGGEWAQHETDDGHTYWYNEDTKESTWEDPTATAIGEGPAAAAAVESRTGAAAFEKIYVGVFADAVKYLKVISLTSCGFTLLAAPLLVAFGDESLALTTRLLVSGGIAGAGIFSTAVLNWVTSPYVIDMLLEDGGTLHLRTRTLFGKLVPHQFPVAAVGPKIGSHPFAVFSAMGKNYYVDAKAVENMELLTTLEKIHEDAKASESK